MNNVRAALGLDLWSSSDPIHHFPWVAIRHLITHRSWTFENHLQVFFSFFIRKTFTIHKNFQSRIALVLPWPKKKLRQPENHDVDRTLFDRVILRLITNDQRPTHSHWTQLLPSTSNSVLSKSWFSAFSIFFGQVGKTALYRTDSASSQVGIFSIKKLRFDRYPLVPNQPILDQQRLGHMAMDRVTPQVFARTQIHT